MKFTITTIDYIVAELDNGQEKIRVGHSATYGDKFQELLNEAFLIYNASKSREERFFPYAFNARWMDDMVNYDWKIAITAPFADVKLEVVELSPSGENYNKILFKKELKFEEFFNAIYASLDNMLNTFGFIGYKHNWAGNFPVYEYLLLKSDKYGAELPKLSTEDDEWTNKVPIGYELNLIGNARP